MSFSPRRRRGARPGVAASRWRSFSRRPSPIPATVRSMRWWLEREGGVPRCDKCLGHVKTGTVSFGQAMPVLAMKRAEQETLAADLFIVLGSSLVVYPAAGFPQIAKENGAALVIVNREETPLDRIADLVLHTPLGDTMGEAVGGN